LEPFKAYRLLKALLERGGGMQDRLLISSGVCFKTHMTSYGGFGYSAIFEEVLLKYFND
jgi:hypothetical protein